MKNPNEKHVRRDPRRLTASDRRILSQELGFPYRTAFLQDEETGDISHVIMDEDIKRSRND